MPQDRSHGYGAAFGPGSLVLKWSAGSSGWIGLRLIVGRSSSPVLSRASHLPAPSHLPWLARPGSRLIVVAWQARRAENLDPCCGALHCPRRAPRGPGDRSACEIQQRIAILARSPAKTVQTVTSRPAGRCRSGRRHLALQGCRAVPTPGRQELSCRRHSARVPVGCPQGARAVPP